MRSKCIPVYVVTGFLDSGKTTFINRLINKRNQRNRQICILQFEHGEEELQVLHGNADVLYFSKKELEQGQNTVIVQIEKYLSENPEIEEIWIEWNGLTPFSMLEEMFAPVSRQFMFTKATLANKCVLKKVILISSVEFLENRIRATGSVPLQQIAAADIIFLRGIKTNVDLVKCKKFLRTVNPGIKVLHNVSLAETEHQVRHYNPSSFGMMIGGICGFVLLYFLFPFFFPSWVSEMDSFINIFLGILLQAIPFLLIGVLLSSALQIFVSEQFITHHFPKNPVLGVLFAVLGGFCLPVCDCASIPLFRSLIKKGVPVISAVVFMTVTPVINPVVILSTYYAFNGNYKMVLSRIGLGIVVSVITAVLLSVQLKGKEITSGSSMNSLLCSCGYFGSPDLISKPKDKILLFLRHSQAEFFDVGKYLILGAAVSSIFQCVTSQISWAKKGNTSLAVSVITMMCMAFCLSLCSSSDAVVARSFSSVFPVGSLLGFLVFGPMIDIKNIIMLSGSFSRNFIFRLCLTTALVCFITVYIFAMFVPGVILL